MINSPIPERGPEANIRMSFAILMKQPIVLMRHVILQLHRERKCFKFIFGSYERMSCKFSNILPLLRHNQQEYLILYLLPFLLMLLLISELGIFLPPFKP
jgi:hypothetical protein